MATKKYIVHVPRGLEPCQIDDFPEGCKRSVKGSLRLAPGILELTEDEFKHLRKHHKDLGRRLRMVNHDTVTPKAAPPPKVDPSTTTPVDDVAPKESVEAPKSKGGGKGKGK